MNKQTIDDFHVFTLHAGMAEHVADWNWKNVRSPFARLYYVVKGNAQVILHSAAQNGEDEVINLRPGHLYFVPPFTLHSNVCDKSFSHYYIHIMEGDTHKFHYLTEYTYPREIVAEESDMLLFQRLCQINPFLALDESDPCTYDNDKKLMRNVELGRQRSLCDKVESRGILYILMSRFLRHAQPASRVSDERILKAIQHIAVNASSHVSVDELAGVANMSKDHFIRRFRKETGDTPVVYAAKRTIERAETLLVTTGLPIKSIAAQLGFDDCSYFYRIFKKYVGVSPQTYRERSM